MAYVTNMQDEEKNQPGGPIAPGGASNTVQLSPNGGVGGVGGPSAGTPAPQGGGQFASLNQYVNANQGQINPTVNKITADVGNQYNTLQGQNKQTLQGIQGQVDQGYTKQNQDILNQAAASPVSFAGNAQNVQNFQGQLNDKYSGPGSAESTNAYTGQLANVNNAITQGQQLTGSPQGRENLLKQYEAAPTAGVTGLNSAIMAQDPNAQARVEQAYQPFSNLVSGLQTGAQGINSNIGQAQTEAQNASTAANKVISDQVGGLNTAVQGQLGAANTQNQNFVSDYNDILSSLGSPTSAPNGRELAELGVDPTQYQNLQYALNTAASGGYYQNRNFGAPIAAKNIDDSSFLQQLSAPGEVTANQVATPEQFQQLQALLTLNNGQTPTGALLDPTQANLANTYQAPTLNGAFDINGALKNASDYNVAAKNAAMQSSDYQNAVADAAHAASQHSGIANTLKNVVTNPLKYTNPLAQPDILKNALKGKDPFGMNPLPTKNELKGKF